MSGNTMNGITETKTTYTVREAYRLVERMNMLHTTNKTLKWKCSNTGEPVILVSNKYR